MTGIETIFRSMHEGWSENVKAFLIQDLKLWESTTFMLDNETFDHKIKKPR